MSEIIYTVTGVKRETRYGMFASADNVDGWSADVIVQGESWTVSMLDGEDKWTVDSRFRENGYPLWSNGFGARYLRTYSVADNRITDALDAAVLQAVNAACRVVGISTG